MKLTTISVFLLACLSLKAAVNTQYLQGLTSPVQANIDSRVLKAGDTMTGPLVIGGGTVTANAPVLDLTQTWNLAGTTFTGLKLNVTDTASSVASSLAEFQVGGVTVVRLAKSGSGVFTGSGIFTGGSLTLGSTILTQDSTQVLALRNGANAQTWNVYGTTDAGVLNYRRIRTTMTTGGAATIAAEGLGTGVSGNTLSFSTDGTSIASMDPNGIQLTAGHLQMVEVAAPSAPGSNKGRLYLEDNGSGKTKLMIRFNTGAAQQIAIEP